MGKRILVTGGARSGKSSFAEGLAKAAEGNILYIATAIAFDEEMKLRIKKHKESRPKEWQTYEGFKGLDEIIINKSSSTKCVLIDCITIMVTNLLFDSIGLDNEYPTTEDFEIAEEKIKQEVQRLLVALDSTNTDAIIVTNELGMGIVPENKLARAYRDIAGRVNRQIAESCDEVYIVVCGIPVKIKHSWNE